MLKDKGSTRAVVDDECLAVAEFLFKEIEERMSS
jgi:hypothetical protein